MDTFLGTNVMAVVYILASKQRKPLYSGQCVCSFIIGRSTAQLPKSTSLADLRQSKGQVNCSVG